MSLSLLLSGTDSAPPWNLHHKIEIVVSHQYDTPLFQLIMEDVMANSVLNTVFPFDWLYIEEEIGRILFV